MFIHPTGDYDVLLCLDPSILPRYFHNVNPDAELLTKRGKYSNRTQDDDSVSVLPGFDPAQMFFKDLQVYIELSIAFLCNNHLFSVYMPTL